MSVLISAATFPNEHFRNYVSNYLDYDGDGILSDDEILRVKTLTVPYSYWNSYDSPDVSTGAVGIENFTELTELTIPFVLAKDVNFGALQKLQKLRIKDYEYSTFPINLDFRDNVNLKELEISSGYHDGNWHDNLYSIKSLYLSPALQQLMIKYSGLKHNGSTGEIIDPETYIDLDFTNCTNIKSVSLLYFHCRSIIGLNNKTQLTDIEFAGLSYLAGTLDLSNDSRLKHLGIFEANALSGINIDGCNNITDIELLYTGIRGSLDFSNCSNLLKVYIVDNNIYSLVLGNHNSLSNLYVLNNSSKIKIQSLDITGCPILMDLVTSTSPNIFGNAIIRYLTAFPNVEDFYSGDHAESIYYYVNNFIYSTGTYILDTNLCYSEEIVLIDIDPPTIINSPIATKAAANGTVTFHVAATSSKLNYLWQYSSDNGTSWTDDANSNTADYSFTALKLDSGNKYRCKVYNVAGEAYSSAATLTVIDPVVINTNLEKKTTVGVGQSVALSIAVSGEDINYQWQVGKYIGNPNGSLWIDAPNASGTLTGFNTNHVLQFSFTTSESTDGKYYRCVLSNDVSNVISEETQIDVIEKPVINIQPKSVNIATGKNVTFSISASGLDLSYQWQVKTNGGSWEAIEEDANDSFYIIKTIKAYTGRQFRCIVTNVAGSEISNAATLAVLDPPAITSDLTTSMIENGTAVDLSITATGDMLQYQWEVSTDNTDTWTPITNETETPNTYSFTATADQNGNYYRCIVSNPVGSVSSSEQQLTVITLPAIVTQPTSIAIGNGEVATFQVTTSGDVSGYQWQFYTSETAAWVNVPENGNAAVYSVTADMSMSGNRYRCLISNPLNSTRIKTKTVTLAVFNPIIITSPTEDYTLEADVDTDATLSVEAIGDDLLYQWQLYKEDTSKWKNIADETNNSYTKIASEVRNGRKYRCQVYNDYLTVYSPIITLSVIIPPPPIIVTEPNSISVGIGKSASFSVEVSNPPVTYQWQVSIDNGSNWTNVSENGDTPTYSIDSVTSETNGNKYRCILTNQYGETESAIATLSIIGVPVITRQPSSVSALVGNSVTFSVQASGEQLQYQWQISKNGGTTWKNAPSSNSSTKTSAYTFTANVSYNNYQFRCIVSNPSSTGVISEAAVFTISAPPEITQNISSITVNDGDAVSFTIVATGGDLEYQWQASIDNGRNWTNVATNGNDSTYYISQISGLQNQIQYRCIVTNDLGSVISNNAIVSVRVLPRIITQPTSISAAYGVSASFAVIAEGEDLHYQWEYSDDEGENWQSITDEARALLAIVSSEEINGRQYRCSVENAVGTVYSNAATLTTFEPVAYDDDSTQVQYTDRYLPSEMADMIRKIKGGAGGTNLDEIQFGEMTEEELYSISTNPGSTDPKYYEEIAEAINTLKNGIDIRDYDIFVQKTFKYNGEYYAYDDDAYGYSKVVVDVLGGKEIVERTIDHIDNEDFESIGPYAFAYCSALSTARFTECKSIGAYAFASCSSLSEISLPSCTSIDGYAFKNCTALQNIDCPKCTYVGSGAFTYCSSLSSITLPLCQNVENSTFTSCYALEYVSLPRCEFLAPSAFGSCSALRSVFIPKVNHINSSCFKAQKFLSDINIYQCKKIYKDAFAGCTSLQSINAPYCNSIDMGAFSNCTALGEANFPSCITIGASAFDDCSSLSQISFSNCTEIGSYAFYRTALEEANFPRCSTIGACAFYSCSSLSQISFPSCSKVGNRAFAKCSSLSQISFPSCITIGASVFENCSSLSHISFPNCTEIGIAAFVSCTALEEADFPNCSTIGTNAFYSCSSLSQISFPNCTEIGANAFANCTTLEEAIFPSCSTIGVSAFAYCSSLSQISFPNCTEIGSSAFNNCITLAEAVFPNCSAIGASGFYSCSSLSQISFSNCTEIGANAFANCITLEEAIFQSCITVYASAFHSCFSLSHISFPNCTEIGIAAFVSCTSLANVSLPMCKKIGSMAFTGCMSLTSISLPACTEIGEYAFDGALETIYLLGSSMCSLLESRNIFDLKYLRSIYVPGSLYSAYVNNARWGAYYSFISMYGINVIATSEQIRFYGSTSAITVSSYGTIMKISSTYANVDNDILYIEGY